MTARKNTEIPPRRTRASADEWTDATAPAAPVEKEPTKKLSLEFPASVHRATKIGAATRGSTMIGEIVEMCRARNGLAPWPADVVALVLAQIKESGEPLPAELLDAAVHQLEADRAAAEAAEAKLRTTRTTRRKSA
ncbi:hypothetical protein [Nocardia paucivorans]|uniref:hypothetical protein n=1 Tax=Nocardia paucivorans TaxID=114259 RepID=UPI0002DD67D7|nr:hypothetical protein [Nocardia paucivorans]